MASQVIFYLLSTVVLVAGLLSVTTMRIFRAAIWLLFCLMGIAGLYFWMEVPFIAAVQIIVYAGGIVVLIIFSIFLTQQAGKKMAAPVKSRMVFAWLAAIVGALFIGTLLYRNGFAHGPLQPFNTDVDTIGTQLLSPTAHGYVLPFEVVSMLLLAAMVGCIVIAMKEEQIKQ